MDAARWQRLDELFQQAVERPADERQAFLEEACDDEDLRREVAAMLAVDEARQGDTLLAGIVDAQDGETTVAVGRPDTQPSLPFEALGPYRLLDKIGEGGLASVYGAERDDGQFRMRVAVKLVRVGFESPDLLARLRLERQILARLEHPNIAHLIDGGTTPDGRPYFVMELIEGERIDHWCDHRGLDLKQRLGLFLQLCDAVHHAHRLLVLHRDIKPSNILVTDDGVPKLLDFGIAKLLDTGALDPDAGPVAAFPTLTATGVRPLTPEFASPEQVRGESLGTASDVYSLGVLLYRLLTGRPPYTFDRRRPAEVEKVICEHRPTRPSTVVWNRRQDPEDSWHRMLGWPRRATGDDLDNIMLEALRKEPDRRYGSASSLADDIRRYLDGLPVSARTDSLSYRADKFIRRHRWPVAASTALLLSLSAGAITTSRQAQIARRAQGVAEQQQRLAEQSKSFVIDLFRAADPQLTAGEPISLRDTLDRGAERARSRLVDDPLLKAELLSTIGEVYLNLSLYTESESLLQEALDLRRLELDEDSDEVIESRRQLARLWSEEERFEEAEQALEEVVAARREKAEPDELATALLDLAKVRLGRGDDTASQTLLTEALDLRRLLGDELGIAEARLVEGRIQRRRGDYEAAEATFREVLEVRRRILGPADPDVSETLNDLAITLQQNGDMSTAEKLFRDTLAERLWVFEEPHELISTALHNLAQVLVNRGKVDAALEICDQLDAQNAQLYQEDHPALARALYLRARSEQIAGRPAEAEVHARRSWEINEAFFGAVHEATLSTESMIAELMVAQKDPGAEAFLRRLVDKFRRAFPTGDYRLSYPLQNLGLVLVWNGELDAAEGPLRESLDLRRRALPADHWETAASAVQLGRCLSRLGRAAEAEDLLRSGLESLRRTFGDDHGQVRRAAKYLAAHQARTAAPG